MTMGRYILASSGAMKWILIAYAIWNVLVFLLFGLDKVKAKAEAQRIKESTLIWCSFVFGGFGGYFGSKVFHHKTQKAKFKVLLPVALIINILVLVAAIAWFMGIIGK
jgi:uncharacterized membrane protein YsdA (DUF1294 family)